MILTFTQWLQATGFFTYLRGSSFSYPVVLSLHMVVLAFFGGLMVLTNLRLLGFAFLDYSLSDVLTRLRVAKRNGLLTMLFLGFLLFGCKAEEYYSNGFFRTKVILLFLLLINFLVFRRSVYDRAADLDKSHILPGRVRLAGGISLLLWISVVCCGRGIGYLEPPYMKNLHALLNVSSAALSDPAGHIEIASNS